LLKRSESVGGFQRTLGAAASLSGVALHSGRMANARIDPAGPNTGIVFRTADGEGGSVEIPADLDHAGEDPRNTSLVAGDCRIAMVEHFLAALYGLGIDNAVVSIEGGEAPIMDGSCAPIIEAIDAVGVTESDEPGRGVGLRQPVFVSDGASHAVAVPCDSLRITVATSFREPVGRSVVDVDVSPGSFRRELSAARTPGFVEEWDALKAAGLARGATKDNVLVVLEQEFGVAPRWADEVCRHKALDLLGDLALLGGRLRAAVTTVLGGHGLNRALVREMQGMVISVE